MPASSTSTMLARVVDPSDPKWVAGRSRGSPRRADLPARNGNVNRRCGRRGGAAGHQSVARPAAQRLARQPQEPFQGGVIGQRRAQPLILAGRGHHSIELHSRHPDLPPSGRGRRRGGLFDEVTLITHCHDRGSGHAPDESGAPPSRVAWRTESANFDENPCHPVSSHLSKPSPQVSADDMIVGTSSDVA